MSSDSSRWIAPERGSWAVYDLTDAQMVTLAVLTLLATGVVFVPSASMQATGSSAAEWPIRVARHATYAVAAALAYGMAGPLARVFASRPATWRWRLAIGFVALSAVLCLATLVPGVGVSVNGARRWLGIGPVRFQPSELAKWASVAWVSAVATYGKGLRCFRRSLLAAGPVAAMAGLVMVEDFGTAALIGLVAGLMLLVGGAPWRVLIPAAAVAGMAGTYAVASTPYRWRRLTSFLDPFDDPGGSGYHAIQSLLSFASGGWAGRGLGEGIQKLGYLPEDTTDFIFAVICEELGLFGAAMVLGTYAVILFATGRAWRVGRSHGRTSAALVAFGIGTTVVTQACVNVAVATVSVPTKGLALPLVSAGGTGLLTTAAALGVLHAVLSSSPHAHEEWGRMTSEANV